MNAIPGARNCLPVPGQELLLSAALAPPDEAAAAWHRWRENSTLETIHHSGTRLLPLIYRNIGKSLAPEDAAIMKGVYRKNLYKNHMLLAIVQRLAAKLSEESIDAMLLKGTALLLTLYGDYGLRTMSDADMLVRRSSMEKARLLLIQEGWRLMSDEHEHAVLFQNKQEFLIDLHQYTIPVSLNEKADALVWERARTLNSGLDKVFIPGPTDLFLHALIHGCDFLNTPATQWAADCVLLTRKNPPDWDYFMKAVTLRRAQLYVRPLLRYLSARWNIAVPESVFRELKNARLTKCERLSFLARFYSPESARNPLSKPRRFATLQRLWLQYIIELSGSEKHLEWSRLKIARGFADYLKKYLKLKSLWAMPFVILWRVIKNPGRLLNLSRR